MTKEQYLNNRIAELRTLLAEGLEQNKIEVTEKSERLIQSFLENTISGYKAINEKSFFDTELNKIDNGWGAVGEKIEFKAKGEWHDGSKTNPYHADERLVWPHDNIGGHEVVKPVERWKPEVGETYWIVTEKGTPYSTVWNEDFFTKSCFDFGNVFKSEPEAFAARERVKKALLG